MTAPQTEPGPASQTNPRSTQPQTNPRTTHPQPQSSSRTTHHHPQAGPSTSRATTRTRLRTLLRISSIACGIQFGWALQLSLLTPYVQELGIPHEWASIIWLCGPLSGLIVQPLVGHVSDRCTSRFGRRRPFILAGAVSIVAAVLVIGYAADIGGLLGDRAEDETKTRAILAFILRFWILDVANNMTQGPCRALLADLTGKDHRRTRVANAYFSLFMAIGNVLGFATGFYSNWFKVLPFTFTSSCNINCANLKAAFIIDIFFIAITTTISLLAAHEQPLTATSSSRPNSNQNSEVESSEHEAFLWELLGTFKYLPFTVWIILIVTALTWIGWFPFLLFDTDWMGREIYGGEPNDGKNYSEGVRMGSLGLTLNSVVLGITSLLMEKLCRKWGAGFTWGLSNILLCLCFVALLVVTAVRSSMDIDKGSLPPDSIVAAALIVFAVLGVPLAITYSVPYVLVSIQIEALGLGQGLSMGVLNLAIVFPQVIVSVGAGPWDALFGGGNSPALAVAAVAAFVGGIIAIVSIPRTRALGKPKNTPLRV